MTGWTRRGLGILAASAASLGSRGALAQGAWPTRSVTVMVPFAPGGSTDFVARLLAQGLSTRFGQQFVVDNRSGASGTTGMAWLARARPDGYTIGVVPNGTFAMAPSLFPNLAYDPARGFEPVGMLATNAMFIAVRPDSPYQTLADLLAEAKSKPGQLSYGSAGIGVANHLGVELLQDMSGTSLLNVVYRSGALGVQAVLGRETTLSFVDSVTAIPFLKSGELRALAFTGATRSAQAPDVPSVAELGFPGYRASTDFGLFAPAGTPPEILAVLGDAARAIMLSDDTKARLAPLSIDAIGGTRDQFGPYAEAEIAKWGELIRKRNIKPE